MEAETDDDLVLCEASGRTAPLTHWSFEQLAAFAGTPPKYLRTLPASIASSAINFGLRRQRREEHQVFADRAAPWTVHAITSQRYARVHHDRAGSRVLDLMADHPAWHLPLGNKNGVYGAEMAAIRRLPGGPRLWGYVQGLTRLSQRIPWQDQRFALDRAASRLLTSVH